MTFRWLTDAQRYTHPRLVWLCMFAFEWVLECMLRVDHDLPKDFRPPAGALIVSNHLRDCDGPLLAVLLLRRTGVHLRGRLPYFAMREDLFQPGGLTSLLVAWPAPVIHLLQWIRLNRLFGALRTQPMRRVREFTWHDTLRELSRAGLGSADPARIFCARGQRELRECLGDLPAHVNAIKPRQLGQMRLANWGLRRLSRPALEQLAKTFRTTVNDQLRYFANRLDDGENVYFAPEGCRSPNGRLGRIRCGTWQLGRMTAKRVPIMPFAISYDALGPGRTRVIVRKGALLQAPDSANPRAFRAELQRAIVACRVITPSHLLAHFLCLRTRPFDTAELVSWMERGRAAAQHAGLALDPALEQRAMRVLVAERLRWLRRRGLVEHANDRWHTRFAADVTASWQNPASITRYLANAFADVAPELAASLDYS